MRKTNDSEKYAAIVARIGSGGASLHPRDVQFYLNYCNRNQIAPVSVVEDFATPPISIDMGAMRYKHILDRLHSGRSIEATDYQFLKRYCRNMGIPLPPTKSKMQFWLKDKE